MAKQQVIFVHGTFATSDDDVGDKWWQRGSQFWKAISVNLCDQVALGEEGRLFRWTGENSERARRTAAFDLFWRVLLPLEEQAIDYHLVGHSHGGNVIRKALMIAAKQKYPLTHFRSWTTVGTPFLQIQSSYSLRSAVAAFLIPTIILLAGAFALTYWIGSLMNLTSESVHHEEIFVILALLMTPVYLFFVAGPVFSFFNSREQRLLAAVREQHESRWLGLWSTRDEAISAIGHVLRAAPHVMPHMGSIPIVLDPLLNFEGRLEAKRTARKPPGGIHIPFLTPAFESLIQRQTTSYLWWTRFYLTFLIWPYRLVNNVMLAPLGDRFIGEQTRRAGAGIDVPGVYAASVEATPFGARLSSGLPASVDQRVITGSDSHAAAMVPQLRKLLAESDGATGFKTFFKDLQLKELVHNSYFDDEAVVKLIAHHINEHSGVSAPPAVLDAECTEWYRGSRSPVS